jgi:hypothetical protein
VQSVEKILGEEMGDRYATTFDQDSIEAPILQLVDYRGWRKPFSA